MNRHRLVAGCCSTTCNTESTSTVYITRQEMLRYAGNKAEQLGLAATVYEQYMETLALPRRYLTILIPSSSLQLITDPEM
jgi:hypothetical protein